MKMKFKAIAVTTMVGFALCVGSATASAQSFAEGFADDFSENSVNADFNLFIRALANPDTAATPDDDGLLVNIVHDDPDGDERAVYELNTRRAMNSVRSTGLFLGERPAVGSISYETQGRFYNSISDGGVGEDDRTGDVEIEISLILASTPENDVAEVCFKDRDSNGDSQPLEASRSLCELFQITGLEVDTPYTLEVGVDRFSQELYAEVNAERIAVSSPTPFFVPNDQYAWARFRVRDGAESANFRLSSLSFDGDAVEFDGAAIQNRYRTDDFDDFGGDNDRSKEVVDGRLRMSASVADSDGNSDAFLRLAEPNDYIEADLLYSSESSVDTTAGGFAAVRLSGLLYNDTSGELDVGNLGSVFASVMLIENADSGLVGEYCAIRSDAVDFSESTDLADGLDDDRCPTFALAVSPDTAYNASLSLDQDARTITYKLGEEVVVYNITTDIFKRDGTLRAQARMANGATGTVVGYFDNLRNDPVALTDEELLASMSGGETGSSAGSSSGGGCSIGQGPKEQSLAWLMLAALLTRLWRKAARRSV